jgi:hypothetical protein
MDAINLQGLWPNFAGVSSPPVIPPATPAGGVYNPQWWKQLHKIKDAELRGDTMLPALERRASGRVCIRARARGRASTNLQNTGRAAVQLHGVGRPVLEISVGRRSVVSALMSLSGDCVLERAVRGKSALFTTPAAQPGEPDPEGAMLCGLEGDSK